MSRVLVFRLLVTFIEAMAFMFSFLRKSAYVTFRAIHVALTGLLEIL